MLVSQSESYLKAAFTDEAEIERVVEMYAEQIFGSSIVYLSQTRISTMGGRGTVPDAIMLDIADFSVISRKSPAETSARIVFPTYA